MKNHIEKSVLLLIVMVAMLFTSCRTEDDLSIDPPEEALIESDSVIALLMQRVATNDGSLDNIIDGASNLTIQLPVTVTVNDVTLNITNEGDYDEILDVIEASDTDDDIVNISYPITVILSDYSMIMINSDSDLEDLTVNLDDDDDIECLDFNYPITISVFNEITETFENIIINNDNQMYNFIETLEDLTAASIVFPITIIYSDGTEETVDSIQELEEDILTADNTCDEDDDNDFDECNTNTYTPIFFEESILGCDTWTVDKLKRNNNNLVDLYESYYFTFNNDGTLVVTENANIFNGTWQATGTEGDVDVSINVIGLPDFNDTWNLCKINLQPIEKQIELKIGTDRLRFGSYCEGDDNDNDLEDILEDGAWIVASYTDDGEDETADYSGYEINFNDDETLFATNGVNTNNGTWSVFANDGKMALDFGAEIPFEEFNDNNWDVISVSNTEVTIQDISGGNGDTDILTLQKL